MGCATSSDQAASRRNRRRGAAGAATEGGLGRSGRGRAVTPRTAHVVPPAVVNPLVDPDDDEPALDCGDAPTVSMHARVLADRRNADGTLDLIALASTANFLSSASASNSLQASNSMQASEGAPQPQPLYLCKEALKLLSPTPRTLTDAEQDAEMAQRIEEWDTVACATCQRSHIANDDLAHSVETIVEHSIDEDIAARR